MGETERGAGRKKKRENENTLTTSLTHNVEEEEGGR